MAYGVLFGWSPTPRWVAQHAREFEPTGGSAAQADLSAVSRRALRGVTLLEQELIERVAARASGHLYASLWTREPRADNTSVSIEIANARARHLPSTSCESRIVLRQEELNPEPDFTALAFFQKAHSYLFKEWSLFVASDQNKAKSVSSPSIGYSGGSVRARLTTLSSPFIMAEGKITIPPPIGLLETDS